MPSLLYERDRMILRLTLPCALLFVAAGCATPSTTPAAGEAAMPDVADEPDTAERIAAVFVEDLRELCGRAFAGRVVVDTPSPAAPPAPSPFAGKPLVMHVRECAADAVRVPFHVGDDRSRTWVLTRIGDGLRLKHDHRHEDGSADKVTLYGGDLGDARFLDGGGVRVEFPVDAESVASFNANGLTASLRNTWAMELQNRRFVYELSRPDGRLFRVEFDLTAPVAAPPPPWGTAR